MPKYPTASVYSLRHNATVIQRTRTCFFNLSTLNLSKSLRFLLFSLCSLRLAHALSAHFWSTPSFSHALATAPLPAALGSLGMTIGVRMRLLRGADWRGTAGRVLEGPSMRICGRCISRDDLGPSMGSMCGGYARYIHVCDL